MSVKTSVCVEASCDVRLAAMQRYLLLKVSELALRTNQRLSTVSAERVRFAASSLL